MVLVQEALERPRHHEEAGHDGDEGRAGLHDVGEDEHGEHRREPVRLEGHEEVEADDAEGQREDDEEDRREGAARPRRRDASLPILPVRGADEQRGEGDPEHEAHADKGREHRQVQERRLVRQERDPCARPRRATSDRGSARPGPPPSPARRRGAASAVIASGMRRIVTDQSAREQVQDREPGRTEHAQVERVEHPDEIRTPGERGVTAGEGQGERRDAGKDGRRPRGPGRCRAGRAGLALPGGVSGADGS